MRERVFVADFSLQKVLNYYSIYPIKKKTSDMWKKMTLKKSIEVILIAMTLIANYYQMLPKNISGPCL